MQTKETSDCSSLLLAVFYITWAMLISLIKAVASLGFSLFQAQFDPPAYAILSLVQAALIGLPALLLSFVWSAGLFRRFYQTMALGSGFAALLAPIHLLPYTASQGRAGLHALAAIFFLFAVRRLNKNNAVEQDNGAAGGWAWGGALALVAAIPWAAWGAFGSPLDALLALLTGLLLGLAASTALQRVAPHGAELQSRGRLLLYAIMTGIFLFTLSSQLAFSFGAMQAILMTALPPVGWALAGLRRTGNSSSKAWLTEGLVIGVGFAVPLMFVDPPDINLASNLSAGEMLQWSAYAAGISMAVNFLLGIIFFALALARGLWKPADPSLGSKAGMAALAFSLAATVLVYFIAGQPGFYGDYLFIELKDQADLSQVEGLPDHIARRKAVYEILTAHALKTQDPLRGELRRLHIPYTAYYLENAIEAPANPLLWLWLKTRPEVDRVLASPRLRPLPYEIEAEKGVEPAPASTPWNLTLIHADHVWEELGVTGKGVIIGLEDSGVQFDHPELFENYRGRQPDGSYDHQYNWLDAWEHSATPQDMNGHGTHTLGTILGKRTGIAPDATWYSCANLQRNLGNPGVYLECMQFMLAPYPLGGDAFTDGDPARGANIVNNSWGCPAVEGCDTQVFLHAVNALRTAGVFFVVSAGNDGPYCSTLKYSPAIFEDVFSVGAIDNRKQLAPFSSVGPVESDGSQRIKPDLLAPGVNVLSSTPGSTYNNFSGTSMAGPHVAGVVALMWSANPKLIGNIDRTSEILKQSAQPYDGSLPSCPAANDTPSSATGYGILDAYKAVQMALEE